MPQRLTRSELRIIEETKQAGRELHEKEPEGSNSPKKSTLKSLVIITLAMLALIFGLTLIIGLVVR